MTWSRNWLPAAQNYLRQSIRFDLVAGLTVAMVVLPQSMAYAAIADVNPIYGIFTAIVTAIVGALAGSSSTLVTGPTNATALVTLSVLAFAVDRADYVEFVFALALLSGAIKLLLGVFRLGGIIRYISNSVLTGFLAAAGILITIDQFGNLFGISIPKDQGVIAILIATIQKIPEINPYVVLTSAVGIGVMLVTRRLSKKIPAALIAIVAVTLLVQILGWHNLGVRLVSDIGLPKNSTVSFHLPQIALQSFLDLLPAAGAVALFSLVEAMSISKALSMTSGKPVSPNREFIGQGLASMVGGLMSCIPSSGSPSRSAVNYNAGARTRLAAAFSGGFVWLSLAIFAGFFGYIPLSGLAAVVVISAMGLINREHIKLTWNTRSISKVVLAVTFAATLLLPLHIAIYLGVLLSIGIHLFESAQIHLSYIVCLENNQVIEKKLEDLYSEKPVIAVINVEGNLFFGAVNVLEEAIQKCLDSGVKVLILRLRRMHTLASTGITTLQWSIVSAQRAGAVFVFSEVTPEIHQVLKASHVNDLIGEERIFPVTEILFEATHRAVNWGQNLIESNLTSIRIDRERR